MTPGDGVTLGDASPRKKVTQGQRVTGEFFFLYACAPITRRESVGDGRTRIGKKNSLGQAW